MTDLVNRNEAPYPHELVNLIAKCHYRPGWKVYVADVDRGQGSKGMTLVIMTLGYNSYHVDLGESYSVYHYFPVPPAAYDRRSWQRWLFDQFLLVEQHECAEFFRIGDERPYAPSHGPGNNPYLIREVGSSEDQRTSFRGELNAT